LVIDGYQQTVLIAARREVTQLGEHRIFAGRTHQHSHLTVRTAFDDGVHGISLGAALTPEVLRDSGKL
jgi:hypothetical protein